MHECGGQLRLIDEQRRKGGGSITRRFIVCLIALLLLSGTAMAAQPHALESFAALYTQNSGYQLDIQAELLSWPDLDELSLKALQQLAEDSSLHLSLSAGQASQARLMRDEKTIFVLENSREDRQQVLSLEVPGSLQPTSYVSAAKTPLSLLLLGQDLSLPSLFSARQTLSALAQAALPQLKDFEEAVKAVLSIKNVGRGVSQLVYALKQEEALAFWQQVQASVQPLLGQLYADLALPQNSSLIGGLENVQPVGMLTIKRILNEEGADIGLQINGRVDINGQTRRLALLGGWSATGIYLSIKLPALRGNDMLDGQLSLATSPETCKGDWKLRAVAGKDSLTASGSILLQAAQKEDRKTLTGSLEARLDYRGAVASKQVLSFKPQLALEGEHLSGSLRLIKQVEGQPAKDVVLLVSGQPAAGAPAMAPLSVIDLDTLSKAQLALEQARLGQALVPALHAWIQSLPEQTQQLLLHDLGRNRRAQDGRTVDALPAYVEPFTVLSQPQNSPTKEDAP